MSDFIEQVWSELSSQYINDHYEEDDEFLMDLIKKTLEEHLPRFAKENDCEEYLADEDIMDVLEDMLLNEVHDIWRQAHEDEEDE